MFVLLVFVLWSASCSHEPEEDIVPEVQDELPSVTVIYEIGAPGDNGYRDLMVKGISLFTDSTGIKLHTILPHSLEEARVQVKAWQEAVKKTQRRALLVLAGSSYEELAAECEPMTDGQHNVLLLESTTKGMPQGVKVVNIDRRAVLYLAGAMAGRTSAHIVAAYRGDQSVDAAVAAFRKGFEAHALTDFNGYTSDIREVFYLSPNFEGYNMPQRMFEYLTDLGNQILAKVMADDRGHHEHCTIILPLAGSSNMGAYFYLLENMGSTMAVIGMDVDCSGFSRRVPYSVVVKVDRMLVDVISQWVRGEPLSDQRTYTMSEGYADVVINPMFDYTYTYAQNCTQDADGQLLMTPMPETYWQEVYDKYRQEALKEEEF